MMQGDAFDHRLSEISTLWTEFRRAHGEPSGRDPEREEAQVQVLRRYSPAIYRYLLGALHDPDAADELFQEFALRFVRGDFHRADAARGRLRDFLKTALFRLVVDAQRRRKRPADVLGAPGAEPAVDVPPDAALAEADRRFLDVWRAELLARAWDALEAFERRTGQPLHTVLKLRSDHPDVRSPDLATLLEPRLGREVSAVWVRKKLSQARAAYTDFLLDAVARSLTEPTREELEQELIDLGLYSHCREALDRLGPGNLPAGASAGA
jgi:RNA polymerase sigma-70 factor (ECF subfamily)